MVNDQQRRDLIALIPRLRRFAGALTGNLADADDVTQATLERAMRNFDQWQDGTRLDRWLFTIARNIWIDTRRRAHNARGHDDIWEMVDLPGDDGPTEIERRAVQRSVRAAVQDLPEDQRILIATIVLEGWSYREAADMLNIPIGTVMSRLSRAKAVLADRLAAEGATA